MKKQGCPLCEMKNLTPWHFVDREFVLCDCLTCKVPMMVWRDHDFPDRADVRRMKAIARRMFPNRLIDEGRRTVKDHYHFHLR